MSVTVPEVMVEVKVTDLKTGVVRFEKRPLRYVSAMSQDRRIQLTPEQKDARRNNEIAERIHHFYPVGLD